MDHIVSANPHYWGIVCKTTSDGAWGPDPVTSGIAMCTPGPTGHMPYKLAWVPYQLQLVLRAVRWISLKVLAIILFIKHYDRGL